METIFFFWLASKHAFGDSGGFEHDFTLQAFLQGHEVSFELELIGKNLLKQLTHLWGGLMSLPIHFQ